MIPEERLQRIEESQAFTSREVEQLSETMLDAFSRIEQLARRVATLENRLGDVERRTGDEEHDEE